MTRPDDRAQLEFLIEQGYQLHACCPPEHHDIDAKCPEKSSGKVPYDLDKRCHLSKWESAPGFTVEQLGRVWKIKPRPNIGLRLGNGVVRLDIDSEKGEEHIRLHDLPLPASWEFTSGRGRGVLLGVPKDRTCTKKIPYEDVELLGDGQQTVIPPSRHRRGTTYEWRKGHAPTEIALADAPDWILNLMETKTERTTSTKAHTRNDQSHFRSLGIEEVLGHHDRNFPSPFHDSEGGVNSSIGEGVHTCWRHNVCHTPLEALAILSGIMGTDGNDACYRAGKELQGPKVSEVVFSRENETKMWLFAKARGILPEDDPDPFAESKTARIAGYRPPEGYFEVTEHPRADPPKPPTEKFIPGIFIEDVLRNERFLIRSVEGKKGRLWRYSDGYYHPDGETYLLTLFKDVMGTKYPQTGRLNRLEILDGIRSGCYKEKGQLEDDTDLIPLENGVFNWRTKKLRPYDQDKDIFFFQLPVPHDPTAASPEIDKFHAEILPEEGYETVIDYLASCLIRRPMKSHFIAYGPPHSGKSTDALLMQAFLGPDSVANVRLQRIQRDRFSSAGLEDKMANIYSEIGRGALKELGQINATTGMDKINLERKGIDSRNNFQPYAKHWFSTNDLPKLDVIVDKKREDVTTMDAWEVMAFFERFCLVEYGQVFSLRPRPGSSEKLMDLHILDKMTTKSELSGWLNQILDRMADVDRSGPRTSRNAKDTMMLYLRDSNPIQAFIVDGAVEFDHNYESSKDAVRGAIHHYCAVHGLATKFSDPEIKKALMHHGVGEARDAKGVETRRHWWAGIRLVGEWMPDEDEFETGKKVLQLIKDGVRKVADRPKGAQKNLETPPPEQETQSNPHPPPGCFEQARGPPPGFGWVPSSVKEREGGNIRSITGMSQNPGGDGGEAAGQGDTRREAHGGRVGETPHTTLPEQHSVTSAPTKEEEAKIEKEDAALRTELARLNEKYVEDTMLDYMIAELLKGMAAGDKVSPFILRQISQVEFKDKSEIAVDIVNKGYAELNAVAERIHKLKKRKAGKEAPR